MNNADLLLTGISQLATPIQLGPHRGSEMSVLDITTDAAIAISEGRISWVGVRSQWSGNAEHQIDLGDRAVIPALVDPHTHAIWGGDRFADFEARAAGIQYEEILAKGGGIRSSVRDTSAASQQELVRLALPRINSLIASGAATIEVKSGYGFTPKAEIVSLEAIAELSGLVPARLMPTLLIHLPPENPAQQSDYLHSVTTHLIPEVARRKLASAVDIFIERESFDADDAAVVFRAARNAGLAVKAHVDQFHPIGGIACCIEYQALSADHLEASGSDEIQQLANSNTVATILPGVTLHLGINAAPGRKLIDAGAVVAVGTDLNPGSSPLFSMQQTMALAVRLNGLTPAEALTAATVNAATALGLNDTGAIVVGARADILVLPGSDWRLASWMLGASPVHKMFIAGNEVPNE